MEEEKERTAGPHRWPWILAAAFATLVLVWLLLATMATLRFDFSHLARRGAPGDPAFQMVSVPKDSKWLWPGTKTVILQQSNTGVITQRTWLSMNLARAEVGPVPGSQPGSDEVQLEVIRDPGYWVLMLLTLILVLAALVLLRHSVRMSRLRADRSGQVPDDGDDGEAVAAIENEPGPGQAEAD